MSLRLDMPEVEYHAHPALSSTQARQLLDSPARYKYGLTHPRAETAAFSVGTAVHTKVLGAGSEVVVLDFPDYTTKAAREARDEALAAGRTVLLAKEMGAVDSMAEAVLNHPTARALFEQEGLAEASMFATDPETGVEIRARFDYYANIAVDLKTTGKAASASGFERSVADFGYHIQEAHYRHARKLETGDPGEFVFVVVEKAAPHLVGVYQSNHAWREMGDAAARRARQVLADCTANDTWPGYPEQVQLIEPPIWAVRQHEEEYA